MSRIDDEYEWKFLRLKKEYRSDFFNLKEVTKNRCSESDKNNAQFAFCSKWHISTPVSPKTINLPKNVSFTQSLIFSEIYSMEDLTDYELRGIVLTKILSNLSKTGFDETFYNKRFLVLVLDLKTYKSKRDIGQINSLLNSSQRNLFPAFSKNKRRNMKNDGIINIKEELERKYKGKIKIDFENGKRIYSENRKQRLDRMLKAYETKKRLEEKRIMRKDSKGSVELEIAKSMINEYYDGKIKIADSRPESYIKSVKKDIIAVECFIGKAPSNRFNIKSGK